MQKKVSFQVERWLDCVDEMRWLWNMHWEELALNKKQIKLNMHEEMYEEADRNNCLFVLTLRDSDKIVGYFIAIIKPHLHYKDSLTAFTDMYFIHKNYRKGFVGIKIFKEAEKEFRKMGVQRIILQTKLNNTDNKKLDKSSIFKRLGFLEAEKVYSKLI